MKKSLGYAVKIAMLAAVSAVVMLLEVPIAFYRLDLSEAVVLIGGFALGPMAAAIIELIKNLLNLLLNGTVTAGVGELANFAMGCAFTVTASYIYKKNKTRKGALIGCCVGALALVAVALPLNKFFLIPAFCSAFHIDESTIVKMGAAVVPAIDSVGDLLIMLTAPFNVIKAVAATAVTLLVYKRLSPILHK